MSCEFKKEINVIIKILFLVGLRCISTNNSAKANIENTVSLTVHLLNTILLQYAEYIIRLSEQESPNCNSHVFNV